MSHEATNWAVKQKGLRPIAKIVLWHLADCHNPTMGCFPTQSYLSEQAEISRSSVNRVLEELELAGAIRREQQVDPETKRQRPTRYRLAFEEGFEPLDVASRVSGSDTENEPEPCVISESSRVSKSAEAVSHSSDTLTSNRTSKEPVSVDARVVEDFDQNVFEVFPQNPSADRSIALRRYLELSPSERISCKRGALRVAIRFDEAETDEPLDQRLKYHPHLPKWIASRGWELELVS